MKRISLFLFLCSGLLISLQAEKKIVKASPDTKFVYQTNGKVKLHMFQFSPANHIVKKDKRPAIVFYFGGGWTGGTTKQFYQQARHFAKLGFVTFCPEYRIKNKHKTSPFIAVEDAKNAVRYIRHHALELGIDPKKIVTAGGSAGGHLAVCTALIKDQKNNPTSAVPNAVMAFNPVLDTTEKGYGLKKVTEARKHEVSPCHQVRKNLPPMIIMTGTKDTTTPYENAVRFTKLMQEAGNRCELKSYQGRQHGFFNSKQFRPKSDGKDNISTNQQCEEFLRSLNFLK